MTGSKKSGRMRSVKRLVISTINEPIAIVRAPASPSRGRPLSQPTTRTSAPTPITANVEPSSVIRANGLSAS